MSGGLLVEAVVGEEALAGLVERVRGPVLTPGQEGYDEARAIQNGLIDRRPGLIVRCTGTADVVEAVNFAREHELLLSVKGGGHNVAGNCLNDGGIVIDLSPMRAVHVDPSARRARVGGGATWADVDRETQLHGLAAPGGIVSTTGVAGLTLHGGMGHLRRKHGLSIDNVVSVEVVTADGEIRTASESENEELFWAIRGAGSNFGVVTWFEFALHPVGPVVMLCAPFYRLEDAPSVLPAWRDFMDEAPEEISSLAVLWSVQPSEPFPQELWGTPVVILGTVHCGQPDEGERAVQPLRELAEPVLDMSQPMPFTVIQSAFDPFFPKGSLYYWKSLSLEGLEQPAIEDLVGYANSRPTPRSDIPIWHQGGAMSRVDAADTAFGARDQPFLVTLEASWSDPSESDAHIEWARGAWQDMHKHSDGSLYLNFPGFGEEKGDLVRAAYGDNHERLTTLKAKYDPTNLFRMNLNITPPLG